MPRQPDYRITIRLKPEERALIEEKAGRTPLAQFFRESALREAAANRAPSVRRPVEDKRALSQVLALLGGSSLVSTFRRVARGVEDGTIAKGEETDVLLRQIADTLLAIKRLIMKALGVHER